ncbi:MAG: D-alanine--D-alanine ligase A [Clostridiales bacterium]|nr:MAG: D-alanine--D-alanine ligase A [Clostridiales bacterium]
MIKKKLTLIFGGKSEEHEISILGARKIFSDLDKNKYDISFIGIDKNGVFKLLKEIPDAKAMFFEEKMILDNEIITHLMNTDIVFAILHGNNGEDGNIQGLFELLGVKYVGCDVLQSSLTIDKHMTREFLRLNNIPVVEFKMMRKGEPIPDINEYPVFVKPASLGSSIGVTKVKSEDELSSAIEEAFKYDDKILIDKAIIGREIECAILAGEITGVGEIRPSNEFYDYEAKYFDGGMSEVIVPADISEETENKIREYTSKISDLLNIKTISRVDYFVRDEEIFFNEINSIPGYTEYSMYSMLCGNIGYKGSEILDILISKVK